MGLDERVVNANDVRVPTVGVGEAILVERYGRGRAKAVILHPDDYEQLREAAELVARAGAGDEVTEAILAARELEDRPVDENLVENRDEIVRLLGL
jgi:PHD/YefM family antitoxin component YafN of YafNO toxin-antitoxin module